MKQQALPERKILPFETASYPTRNKYLAKLTMQHTSQDVQVVTISPLGCGDYTSRGYTYKPTFRRNLISISAVSLNVAKHQLQGVIPEGSRHCENLKSQNCYSSSILKGIHTHRVQSKFVTQTSTFHARRFQISMSYLSLCKHSKHCSCNADLQRIGESSVPFLLRPSFFRLQSFVTFLAVFYASKYVTFKRKYT